MRKNKFLVLLALLAVFVGAVTLASCGHSHGVSNSKNPTTMVGEWRQTNANSDGWMTASISGNSIRVNLRGRDSNSIFWVGSFDTSRRPHGTFKVVSIGDQRAMKWALMASSEKRKTFSYDNGVLSFGFSALNSSTTIHMTKSKSKNKSIVVIKPSSTRKSTNLKVSTSRATPKLTIKKNTSPRKSSSIKK
jgi:hypothetical protein